MGEVRYETVNESEKIKTTKVPSLDKLWNELNIMNLKSDDVVLYDLDGSLRREGLLDRDVFVQRNEGFLRDILDKALRWGVSHGVGLRRPDYVYPKIFRNIQKFQCRKAIVTDNTVGGHWVSGLASKPLRYSGSRWFELAKKDEVAVFAQDTNGSIEDAESSWHKAFMTRNGYLTALLFQLMAQFGTGAVNMGIRGINRLCSGNIKPLSAPDYRYKAVGRKKDRGVEDVSSWIKQNEQTLRVGRLIMVGDEESDLAFFNEVVRKISEDDASFKVDAYYFDIGFKC